MLGLLKRPDEDLQEQIAALYRRLARDPDPAAMRKTMSSLYKAGRHAECLLMVEAYEEAFAPHPFVLRTRAMLERRNAFSFRQLAEALRLKAGAARHDVDPFRVGGDRPIDVAETA